MFLNSWIGDKLAEGGRHDVKIGQFDFDQQNGNVLSRNGLPVPLKPRPRTLLVALARAEGRTVAKDALMDAIWPDVTVSEDSLYQVVAEARRVLGPDGANLIQSVPREGYRLNIAAEAPPDTKGRWRIAAPVLAAPVSVATVVVAIIVVATVIIAGIFMNRSPEPPIDARHPVIAVLPFETLVGSDAWQRRGHGLSVEVATGLARLPWLDVIAPEASDTLAGEEPINAAALLGARYILDGSLAADEATLRVSANLTDAATRRVLWSERWNRVPEEFLDLEELILDRVTSSLGGNLTGVIARAELQETKHRQPGTLDAYDQFLLGIEAKHHWNTDGFVRAVSHFRNAVELDPDYAKAWSFLSLNLSLLALEARSREERERLWEESRSAAELAYSLDQNDSDVLWRVARERAAHGDLEGAAQTLRRSVELAPGNADVLMVAAWTSHYAGVRGEEPLLWARRAHSLTPIRPAKYEISLGLAAFSAGDYVLCAQTLRNAPPTVEVIAHLAAAEALLGNLATARMTADQLRRTWPDFVLDDLFGPSGLGGFDYLDDLRQGADLARLPISR